MTSSSSQPSRLCWHACSRGATPQPWCCWRVRCPQHGVLSEKSDLLAGSGLCCLLLLLEGEVLWRVEA